jgi:hypothetical protein
MSVTKGDRSGLMQIRPVVVAWILLLVLGRGQIAAQGRSQKTYPCDGPTMSVIVMALDDPINSGAYLIIVKNGTADSIMTLVVGDGERSELPAIGFAVPREITGPRGWEAQAIFKEESGFMHWFWAAKTRQVDIQPGELGAGFKVVLPPFPERLRNTFYPNGTPARPIKVSDLPFQVGMVTGNCVWGRIRPLTIG